MRTFARLAVPLMALSLLSACAVAPRQGYGSSGGYGHQSGGVGQTSYGAYGQPVQGTITGIEVAQGGGQADVSGAVIGGVLGAVAGRLMSSESTKGYRQRNVGTALGAAVGAAIGHQVQRESRGAGSYRVTVSLDRGGAITLEQRDLGDLRVGDRVRVEQDRVVRG